jgi:Xaa-Pro aminopeptidase
MTLGTTATDVEQRIDFDALRAYKLQRVRDQLEEKELGAGCQPEGGQRSHELDALGLQVGHGVGLSKHEKPITTRAVSLAMPLPIEAGMHFALERFAGDGDDGARIESQVVVTETGHQVITKWPCEELMVCDPR